MLYWTALFLVPLISTITPTHGSIGDEPCVKVCAPVAPFHYSQCLDCEEQETNNTVNLQPPLDCASTTQIALCSFKLINILGPVYVSSCADAGFPVKNVTVENAFNGGAGQMGPRGFGVVALLAGVLGTGLPHAVSIF
ncbi:hypothetical protein B0H13DRAFT_2363908 [Mycena leptocephala]|nr:hypothetical protein B0H13DRAFT_2363908 [Mycena leptocephala]